MESQSIGLKPVRKQKDVLMAPIFLPYVVRFITWISQRYAITIQYTSVSRTFELNNMAQGRNITANMAEYLD